MSCGCGRLSYIGFDEIVVDARKVVPAGVVVDGGIEGSDENALSHPAAVPVLINGENFEIVFPYMVIVVSVVSD